MNIHDPEIETEILSEGNETPTEQEAREALAVLRRWASGNDATAFANLAPIDAAGALARGLGDAYPALSNEYPTDLVADKAYISGLPDFGDFEFSPAAALFDP